MFDYFFRKPSNHRDWQEDVLVTPRAEVSENSVTVHNIRDFKYRSEFDYDKHYYDRTFDLNKLQDLYLGVVPFSRNPLIMHILLKFVFEDDELVFSAEVRKQKGQTFIAWKTLFRNYELIYLFGSSSDLIDLRNKYRVNEPVYTHRLELSKEERKNLLKNLCTRANRLADNPEFFNLFFNNCGYSVVKHLHKVAPRKLPLWYPFYIINALNNWTENKITTKTI